LQPTTECNFEESLDIDKLQRTDFPTVRGPVIVPEAIKTMMFRAG
jgi:hypothetical protein